MHQQQTLPLTPIQLTIERQLRHPNNPIHRRANLMRHIRQELALRPIRELGRLARGGVPLNRVAQVEHHLVDLSLERVHFARGLNGDEAREVAVHGCLGDLREAADLGREVVRHGVYGHAT